MPLNSITIFQANIQSHKKHIVKNQEDAMKLKPLEGYYCKRSHSYLLMAMHKEDIYMYSMDNKVPTVSE